MPLKMNEVECDQCCDWNVVVEMRVYGDGCGW